MHISIICGLFFSFFSLFAVFRWTLPRGRMERYESFWNGGYVSHSNPEPCHGSALSAGLEEIFHLLLSSRQKQARIFLPGKNLVDCCILNAFCFKGNPAPDETNSRIGSSSSSDPVHSGTACSSGQINGIHKQQRRLSSDLSRYMLLMAGTILLMLWAVFLSPWKNGLDKTSESTDPEEKSSAETSASLQPATEPMSSLLNVEDVFIPKELPYENVFSSVEGSGNISEEGAAAQ